MLQKKLKNHLLGNMPVQWAEPRLFADGIECMNEWMLKVCLGVGV